MIVPALLSNGPSHRGRLFFLPWKACKDEAPSPCRVCIARSPPALRQTPSRKNSPGDGGLVDAKTGCRGIDGNIGVGKGGGTGTK